MALQVVVGYPVAKSVTTGGRDSLCEEQEAALLHFDHPRLRVDWSPRSTRVCDGEGNAPFNALPVLSLRLFSENSSVRCGAWLNQR
jgi:hypothetical protein